MSERRRDRPGPLAWLLLLPAAAIVIVTVLSAVPTNEGWARVWDFPRMQIVAVGVVLLAVLLLLRAWRWGWSGLAGVSLLAVALAYLAWRLVPYQPVYGVDMADAGRCPADARLSVLVANVLQKNGDRAAMLDVLAGQDADVVVLLEVDRPWLDALGPLVARYPHRVLEPRDNTYGMAVLSRLPLTDARTLSTFGDDTPLVTGVLGCRAAGRCGCGPSTRARRASPRTPTTGTRSLCGPRG